MGKYLFCSLTATVREEDEDMFSVYSVQAVAKFCRILSALAILNVQPHLGVLWFN